MQANMCECCGAKIVEYKHVLNKGLVSALFELAKFNHPVSLSELDITRNQWTNFQKLRYWGLVGKELHADGSGTGHWFVTSSGRAFIDNQFPMPKEAWTYRGETIRLEGSTIYFSDIYDPHYRERLDYARDAKPYHLGGNLS